MLPVQNSVLAKYLFIYLFIECPSISKCERLVSLMCFFSWLLLFNILSIGACHKCASLFSLSDKRLHLVVVLSM